MENEITGSPKNIMFELLKKETVRHSKEKITIMHALMEKYGEDAYKYIMEVMGEKSKQEYADLQIPESERTIEKLIQILWEPLKHSGMKYEVLRDFYGYQMQCTSCPIADLYRALGAEDVGFVLYCSVDEKLTEGFNNKIGFRRTKTLMQGHDCCNHYYYMKQ